MNQFIKRDFVRTESDDYKLNVQSTEGKYGESLPIYENEKNNWLDDSTKI